MDCVSATSTTTGVGVEMMKKRILNGVAVFAVLYCTAYVALRSQRIIMHFSNADHWRPEKQSPGHFVDIRSDKNLSDPIIKIAFFPAMRAEQMVRNIAD